MSPFIFAKLILPDPIFSPIVKEREQALNKNACSLY